MKYEVSVESKVRSDFTDYVVLVNLYEENGDWRELMITQTTKSTSEYYADGTGYYDYHCKISKIEEILKNDNVDITSEIEDELWDEIVDQIEEVATQ